MKPKEKLKEIRKTLQDLYIEELFPDEFVDSDVIVDYVNKLIAIIDNDNIITVEEQAEAENVSEETILANKVCRLEELGHKLAEEEHECKL